MGKEYIFHELRDWSKVDERESFWSRVDFSNVQENFGIHIYNNDLWTSGCIGIGRLYDHTGKTIQDDGKEHILVITSSFGLDPWKMLKKVMLDDEYDAYLAELDRDNRYLYRICYEQSVVKIPRGIHTDADILVAISFIEACYSLCRKGLKKAILKQEENFTAKLHGKIDVAKNIKHNTVRGRTDRFYCKYVTFGEDILENQILKAAVLKCRFILKNEFGKDTSLQRKVAFCLNALSNVQKRDIPNSAFNEVEIGGLYSYYKPAIQQGRAILKKELSEYSGDASGEHSQSYCMPYQINMETLFEYFARTTLKETLSGSKYRLEKYSTRLYVQKTSANFEEVEKGIHLMPFCIPDIIVVDESGYPAMVIDAKYKPNSRSDRADSHQLLAYALLTGVRRFGFILPAEQTSIKSMKTTQSEFLEIRPDSRHYYELLLGNDGNGQAFQQLFC